MRNAALFIGTLVFFSASDVSATPSFPGVIQQHLGTKAAPECKVCHKGGVTGSGTVTTPFGNSMRARGLVKNDEGSLKTALDALRAEKTDSNKDGRGDIDALIAGVDPNVAGSADGGPGAEPFPDAEYGCGNMSGASPSGLGGALMVAFALMRSIRRNRR
jgi:hypothetical protein